MLKNQLFGVEIEMTGITRAAATEIVAGELNTAASHPEGNCYHTRTITDCKNRVWKVMRDGSILAERNDGQSANIEAYKVELVTPPLNYEDIDILQNIIRKLRTASAKVNHSCGIHIHIDGSNHNAYSIRRMVGFVTARQELINDALNNYDRFRWCKPLSHDLLKKMKTVKELDLSKLESIWYSTANDGYSGGINHEHYNKTRYHGLNLHAFFSKGTVEFRLFNSTLHAGKIKAYIQFCLAVSAWAISSDDNYKFISLKGYTPEKKVTLMRNVLTKRLGLYGDEFKTCRLWMMDVIKRNAGMTNTAAA